MEGTLKQYKTLILQQTSEPTKRVFCLLSLPFFRGMPPALALLLAVQY